jgi:1-aminocyclopropane-1-carboxylate deaminase/D-cysteine desulfhydrase-like pyridoxal-dependent ACC family enzyme
MLFGVYDLIRQGYFKAGSVIVAVHTGGIQGIAGMEERLGRALA